MMAEKDQLRKDFEDLQRINFDLQRTNITLRKQNESLCKEIEELKAALKADTARKEKVKDTEEKKEFIPKRINQLVEESLKENNSNRKNKIIRALILLSEKQHAAKNELMAHLGCSSGTVSRLVETMKKENWIRFEGYRKKGRYALTEHLKKMFEN